MTKETRVNLIYELRKLLGILTGRLESVHTSLGIPQKQERLKELEALMHTENFWMDQTRAGETQKEQTSLTKEVSRFSHARTALQDSIELLEMIQEDELDLLELEKEILSLQKTVLSIEMEHMLAAPQDKNNAILSINVGQGGVESQDFVEMLLRMYKRYAERRGYQVEIMDLQPAEEAGFKNVTLLISGPYAYGYLKSEIGVHRLVRISPFDANSRRHTSFASVWVLPEIDDTFAVEIHPEDLRIDTFRAGGAGGQHVNKTDSAVRITHLPTNTVVACQAERSQVKNRSTAMKLLRAKLYELEMKKRLVEKDKAEAEKMEASFGSQIRNYVLAPYRLVKDLRSGLEIGNVDAVLDGEIQPFIEAYLLRLQQKS